MQKKIKKEIDELVEKSNEKTAKLDLIKDKPKELDENLLIKEDKIEEWESFDEDKISELKMEGIKGYKYDNYTLYEKEIEVESGKKRLVRFFSKGEPEGGKPIELPNGYEVIENKKTGVPYLRKKK